MQRGLFIRILICILAFSICLYSYVDRQNDVTLLRLAIPTLAKEIRTIGEENAKLRYDIEQFESPQHLMELARQQRFSHLKHPLTKEVMMLQEGIALQLPAEDVTESLVRPRVSLAVGAK